MGTEPVRRTTQEKRQSTSQSTIRMGRGLLSGDTVLEMFNDMTNLVALINYPNCWYWHPLFVRGKLLLLLLPKGMEHKLKYTPPHLSSLSLSLPLTLVHVTLDEQQRALEDLIKA